MACLKQTILILSLCLGLAGVALAQQQGPAPSIVTIGGESYYVYTVQKGDTFYSLKTQYSVDEAAIRTANPHLAEGLQAGQVIKIPVVRTAETQPMSERKMSRLFDTHTVNQGETAYAISQRYGISLQTIIEDNPGFDPAHLSIGQKVNIRIKSQGQTPPEQIKQEITSYTEALNSVSGSFTYYNVGQGETLYSLSRKLGIPIDTLRAYNAAELKDGLKMGSILRIPSSGEASSTTTGGTAAAEAPVVLPPQPTGEGWTPPARPVDERPFASQGGEFRFKEIDVTAPVRVALLLPLQTNGSNNPQFLEFYQGFLVAMDELKQMGISTRIDLFNTGRSADEVRAILRDGAISQADLIVGPVYEDCFAAAADFATERGIPIVSPLGTIDQIESPAAFQVFPTGTSKNEKLREEFGADRNVIVISSTQVDTELKADIDPLLPATAHRLSQGAGLAPQIEKLLSGEKENVLVVLAATEAATDEILARIASVQNNLTARSLKNPVIRVIGSAKWARYQNIDRSLYFKLNVCYITAYHADRGNQRVVSFDNRYLAAFSSLPSQYSYRGYDVGKLFVGTIKLQGNRFAGFLNDRDLPLLETPYHFTRTVSGKKYVNDAWAKVCYTNNYTIDVK